MPMTSGEVNKEADNPCGLLDLDTSETVWCESTVGQYGSMVVGGPFGGHQFAL